MLTKTAALELADKGTRVNGIAPGAIATDMNKEVLENQEKKEKKEQGIALEEIARIKKTKGNDIITNYKS